MANDSNWGEIYLSTWWGDEFFNINSLSNDAAPKGFGYIGDEYPPVVAYSTHRVIGNSVYPSIRTRRSSDNGEQNIDYSINADLDVVGLEDFVNVDVNAYTSDFRVIGDPPVDQSDLDDFGGTGEGGQSIAGEDDAYKFTTITGTDQMYASNNPFSGKGGGNSYRIQALVYLPSTNAQIDKVRIWTGYGAEIFAEVTDTDTWKSIDQTITITQGSALRFQAYDGTDITPTTTEANVFYLKNIVLTQTTADGGVVVFRDQVGSIYNKDTFDFSGGTDGFITTDATNDKIERLESYQGVNNVVRWYVQTTNGGTHQARNNNGMNESYRYFVSCKLYLPSTNANITKLALYNGSDYFVVVDGATQSNQWVTITDYIFFGAANPRFFIIGLNDDEDLAFSATAGEEFYFADVVIDGDYSLSNTTADEQPLIVDGGTTETDDFIDFDGSNDRLVTKAIDTFQGDFTIDLEVDFTDVTTRQAIFTNRTTTSDRFGFTIWNSNLYFDYYDGATYTGGRVASMTTGTYRITLTRASGVFTIYINGTSQTISSVGGLLGSGSDDQMCLGDYRNVTNATNPFFGRVKTCIVYNSALDQAHATRFNEYLQ